MAALVQSFPQQTGTVTMLQTRPASAGGMLPAQSQSSSQFNASQPRSTFYGNSNPVVYRAANAPIQPYAFTSTPSLHTNQNWQQSGNTRQSAAPQLPRMKSFDSSINLGYTSRQQTSSSSSNNKSNNSAASVPRYVSRDDSSLPGQGVRRVTAATRPQSAYMASATPQISFNQSGASSRTAPDRYRRPTPRSASEGGNGAQGQQKPTYAQVSAAPSGSGMASIGHLYASEPANAAQSNFRRNSDTSSPASSTDDMQLYRKQSHETGKRTRRRSLPSLDANDHALPEGVALKFEKDKRNLLPGQHSRVDSSESSRSSLSGSSRPSSTNRNTSNPSVSTLNPASNTATTAHKEASDKSKDSFKLVNIPPRGSSDAASRLNNPSQLSTPVTMDGAAEGAAGAAKTSSAAGSVRGNSPKLGGPVTNTTSATNANDAAGSMPSKLSGAPSHLESPAMRHLSAINQKGGRARSKTSRLRRAFSFGSAAEFHKAAGTTADEEVTREVSTAAPTPAPIATPSKLQKEPTNDDLYDAEQARIAQQQEEAGIGNSIYANAKIFSGSNDNLSISSTASSASIMIRKMGRGVKKTSRSLAGLFRPKSVIGVPAADPVSDKSLPTTSPSSAEATVSMVTVEAERELVNVTPDVHAQQGGGTGFPRLERNSMDASRTSSASDRLSSSGTDNSGARKSIVGGERERAEVLAAVRKGILKNTAGAPGLASSLTLVELQNPPTLNDSPASSAPSTPTDDIQGQKRSGSVTIGGEDYFISAMRLRQDTQSGSSTPQGSMKRNATFSPRIVFHDTWPPQEYDRRGEIATCNRLTPMLAQQIKEELNSFKMEMEVHENSKIYTHFF